MQRLDEFQSDYTVLPRRKAGQTAMQAERAPVQLSQQVLASYFGMSLTSAAKELGICATAIKKACRKVGILKWPYRDRHLQTKPCYHSSFRQQSSFAQNSLDRLATNSLLTSDQSPNSKQPKIEDLSSDVCSSSSTPTCAHPANGIQCESPNVDVQQAEIYSWCSTNEALEVVSAEVSCFFSQSGVNVSGGCLEDDIITEDVAEMDQKLSSDVHAKDFSVPLRFNPEILELSSKNDFQANGDHSLNRPYSEIVDCSPEQHATPFLDSSSMRVSAFIDARLCSRTASNALNLRDHSTFPTQPRHVEQIPTKIKKPQSCYLSMHDLPDSETFPNESAESSTTASDTLSCAVRCEGDAGGEVGSSEAISKRPRSWAAAARAALEAVASPQQLAAAVVCIPTCPTTIRLTRESRRSAAKAAATACKASSALPHSQLFSPT